MTARGPNPKIFIVLTALTVLAGSALAYMQFNAYGQVKTDVEKLRAEAKDSVEVQKELDDAILKLNDTRAKLTHLEQSVPEMEYVPTMLKELEKLGKECGIAVTGVRPVPKQVAAPVKAADGAETTKRMKKAYVELDIEVKGRGDYGSVMQFINGLTTFPKIVAARTVSMQPKNDNKNEGGAPKLDVTIELRAFLFPSEGGAKDDEESEEPTEKAINLSGRNRGVN